MWVPPAGWPAPPTGWVPSLGWQPDPSWPAVPAGHQWWQPTARGRRRRRIAIALVGVWSSVGFLDGMYRIVVVSLQDRALHARHSWYQPHWLAIDMFMWFAWLCATAVLIPAGSIGAAELWGQSRSARARASAFVAVLCLGVVGQYWVALRAARSTGPTPIARDAWLHDGRSWLTVMCLLVIVVLAVSATLLKLSNGHARVPTRAEIA